MSTDVPQKPRLTPFLTKTYQLVDNSENDEVISWNKDGSNFIVWNTLKFSKDLLPKFFKHNNFSSFVRQLNTYGFRKIGSDQWEFNHDCFRKGQIHLLCDIRRKLPIPNSLLFSNESNSLNNSELIVENDRLKRKNGDLNKENGNLNRENGNLNRKLKDMKVLFNNVFNMMSKHTNTEEHEVIAPLDLFSSNEVGAIPMEMDNEVNPTLFGVQIGGKRARVENDKSSECNDQVRLHLGDAAGKY